MVGVTGELFLVLGLIFIITAAAAFVLRIFKQPQILAYVLVGILITPVFKIVTNSSVIESISMIGIAFLLFIVGLEIDLKKLKSVTLISTLGGSIQIITLFVMGFLIALLLGFVNTEAAYLGLMVAFSSTMIVAKLLSDKRELNTLHGRIVIGILLIEDIVAIFALSVLTSINSFSFSIFGLAILKFVILFAVAYVASKYLFPRIFRFAAQNQELLLISSLAVCFLFSLSFYYLGFSIAIGAFLAGLSLGNLDYNLEIIGKVKSLRDFFSLIFFVSLGMSLSLAAIKPIIIPFIVFFLFLILFKPLLTMTICSVFKYTHRPAFLTAISLTQMGEFSLIIAAQGLLLGHISEEIFSLVVLVMLATVTFSSYTIKYDQFIYDLLKKPLKIFDIFITEGMEYLPSTTKPKIILCGHNRIGYSILKALHKVKKEVLIIDYNPEIISEMIKKKYHCLYGDVADEEIIERMDIKEIEMLISTVPELTDNLLLIKKVRAVNNKAKIILTASEIDEAMKLYNAGADYVIMPHFLGGEHVANLISDVRSKKMDLCKEKIHHLSHLKERKEIGHEHPKN